MSKIIDEEDKPSVAWAKPSALLESDLISIELEAELAATEQRLEAVWTEIVAELPELKEQSMVKKQLRRLFICSPFAAELCMRDHTIVQQLLKHPLQTPPAGPQLSDELRLAFATVTALVEDVADEALVMAGLRHARNTQMLKIIWRDLVGCADVVNTIQALSNLADFCVQLAQRYAHAQLVERFGEALDSTGKRQGLIVLAMGKLGGQELNFSSDIDLILVYPSAGETDGPRAIDNASFFKKLAQSLVRLLGKITEDGFVFRVDLRLRPFGESGPLVMNFDGVEHYYLTQGREWERYAMIKARPLCGLPEDCDELMAMLKPFVYRRYLDYSAIASLRDLKSRITAKITAKGMQNNVKLGPGGIREIEFIGQAFQLVRGGREPGLQCRSIMPVLQQVSCLGLMQEHEVRNLLAAYCFLRRVENALQMMRDQQTHTLPQEKPERARLAFALNYTEWSAFMLDLVEHQNAVQMSFQVLFQAAAESEDAAVSSPYSIAAFAEEEQKPVFLALLQSRGFERPNAMLQSLEQLVGGAFYRNLSALAQQRVDALIPVMLQTLEQQDTSWRAFDGLLKLLRSVAGRSAYLQVLCETPAALRLLARLFGKSSWLAEFVSQHPIVIDELLDYRQLETLPDYDSLQQEMSYVIERVKHADLDIQMDSLRQFRQAATLRVAAADLEKKLNLMAVSDRLSWIAEITLQAVSDLVWDQLVSQYGKPQCVVQGETMSPGFAIAAYGKLGGIELGYGSDLDIVFLHESEGEAQHTSGPRSIENPVFFARLAQKAVHFLSTLTPAGVLYEIDTRLRPNGHAGLLVSGLCAFEQYQRNDAWTWEHQALVRARVVVGNVRIRERFARVRRGILCRPRESGILLKEVTGMRQKMRDSLGSDSDDTFDLKQDAGGIADIEFMVQYIVLLKSSEYSELTHDTDNIRLLASLGQLGLLGPAGLGLTVDAASEQAANSAADANINSGTSEQFAAHLREAYLYLRRRAHQLALLEQGTRVELRQGSDTKPDTKPDAISEVGPVGDPKVGPESSGAVDSELELVRLRVMQIWSELMST